MSGYIGNQPPAQPLGPEDFQPGSVSYEALAANAKFATGTRIGFNQTAAPTGWTKDTTAAMDDSIMRIVTGTVSNGGTNGFSSVNAQSTVGNTTLTESQIPSHTHTTTFQTNNGATGGTDYATSSSGGGFRVSNSTGGGSAHNHTITMNIKYRDFIVAVKD